MYDNDVDKHMFEREGGIHMEPMQKLKNMIAKLNDDDDYIIKQLIAILFRYLEKRGRI